MTDSATSGDVPIEIAMDDTTRPFWEAARERRLTIPKCGDCGRFRMPPSPFCPHCQSMEVEFPTLSGRGIVYSFSIVHPHPKAASQELQAIGLVELPDAQGARLFTRFVDVRTEDLHIGMPVEVRWKEVGNRWCVPHFAPAAG